MSSRRHCPGVGDWERGQATFPRCSIRRPSPVTPLPARRLSPPRRPSVVCGVHNPPSRMCVRREFPPARAQSRRALKDDGSALRPRAVPSLPGTPPRRTAESGCRGGFKKSSSQKLLRGAMGHNRIKTQVIVDFFVEHEVRTLCMVVLCFL